MECLKIASTKLSKTTVPSVIELAVLKSTGSEAEKQVAITLKHRLLSPQYNRLYFCISLCVWPATQMLICVLNQVDSLLLS